MKYSHKRTHWTVTAALLLALALPALEVRALDSDGWFEAEDADWSSGSEKFGAGSSGGSYLDGNNNFNVTWNLNLTAGDKVLTFGIKVPSGSRSMGVYVNGSKVGVVSSSSTSWHTDEVTATLTGGGDTIELRDSEGTAELDVDYLSAVQVTQFRYQAEAMVLNGYSIQSDPDAAEGQYIQLTGAGGTATQSFAGVAGIYTLDAFYFDESDGNCTFELRVNGLLVDSWVADEDLGETGISAANRTLHRTHNLTLAPGSVIAITCTQDGAAYGALDEILLATTTELEAEDMTLTGYSVQSFAGASGGQYVSLSGTQGSASTVIAGLSAGDYDVTVDYFDENDGDAGFKLYLNDEPVDGWLADRDYGSGVVSAQTKTLRRIRRVYLQTGDVLEITGGKDGNEPCPLDRLRIAASPEIGPKASMTWNTDGSIASLILNDTEQLDASEYSLVDFRVFDGYSIDTFERDAAEIKGSVVELSDSDREYVRTIFRIDEYDHHVTIRLIGLEGVPKGDDSLNIRMHIPFLTSLNYQALDTLADATVVGGDTLRIDWPYLSTRGAVPGGFVAVYGHGTAAQNQAAIDEINAIHGGIPYFMVDPIAKADAIDGAAYNGTLEGTAADSDSDDLIFTRLSGPDWLNVATNGLLSGTPAVSDLGLNSWTVQVADLHGGTDTATLNITVTSSSGNRPPSFIVDPINKPAASAGVYYRDTVAGTATDPEGDWLTYSLMAGGPGWLTMEAGGAISGMPTSNDVGPNLWTVQVSDGNGGADTSTLSITVSTLPGGPLNILLVSNNDGQSQSLYDWLTNETHTVTREQRSGGVDDGVGTADGFDLIIFARASNSGDYDDGTEPQEWNGVPVPLICMNPLLLRSNRWAWVNDAASYTWNGTTGYDSPYADPGHPFLTGLTAPETTLYAEPNTMHVSGTGTLPSGSTVVATANGRAGIVSIPAGAVMYQGLGVSGAERIGYFFDHNSVPTNWAVINENGKQILRNMIAGYQVPMLPDPEITGLECSTNGDVWVTFTPGGAGHELLFGTHLADGLVVNPAAVFNGTNTFWVPGTALNPGQGYFGVQRPSP